MPAMGTGTINNKIATALFYHRKKNWPEAARVHYRFSNPINGAVRRYLGLARVMQPLAVVWQVFLFT